jgi:hypothetical protein
MGIFDDIKKAVVGLPAAIVSAPAAIGSEVNRVLDVVGIDCRYEKPVAYTAKQLANVTVGKSRVVPGTCTTWLQADGRWCPDNGEFVPVTGDSCAYDSVSSNGKAFDCGEPDNSAFGCGSTSDWIGHCEIAGSQTKCERQSYSATAMECCKADGVAVINGRTCDPQYRNAASDKCNGVIRAYCNTITSNPDHDPACKSYMASSNKKDTDVRNSYCSRGNNLYNSDMCRAWVTKPTIINSTIIDTLMQNKCNVTNLNDEPCKSYIRNRSTEDSSYDDIMTQYCIANPNDMLCRCIMSKHNDNTDGALKGRPECIDPSCAGEQGESTPFKTYDMNQNSDNCSYFNCQQWVEFGPTIGKENVNIAEMNMNCGPSDYDDPGVKENKQVTGDANVIGDNSVPKNSKSISNDTLIALLFLLLVIIIIIGFGIKKIWKRNKGSVKSPNPIT